MDSSRFDTWTRRRFGLAAGGMAATLARLTSPADADARNKKKKKKKNKKKKQQCRTLGQVCRQTGKRKRCCQGKQCEDVDGQDFRCCKALGQPCAEGDECCSGWCIQDECGVT